MSEAPPAGPETLHNPYPGLRPFRSDEKHLFFGRERQVDRMIEKLAANRLLAVVGGSGSGKSSLVNCGLRPALHRGSMSGAGAAWRMAQLRPGSDPVGALARALGEPGVLFDEALTGALSAAELIETTLRLGPLGLVDIVEQADLPPGTNLLVVADQFEELFRFRGLRPGPAAAGEDAYTPPEDAQAFVALLLAAAAQTALPIYVVLTMRSDFLGDCAQFDGLPEAINEGQYLVPRLTRSEIRAAISGPAAVAGRQLSPVLVTRLLNDVGDNPDQLSILQHALNRTWAHWQHEGREQGDLDLPHYLAIGRMEKALDNHAEKAYAELASDERQTLAAQLFKALTDKTTDARGTRRPTPLATLAAITGATPEALVSVIEVFRKPSRSFLMPPMAEALTPDTVIDISHESLMRVWKRLSDWGDAEALSAGIYTRLAERAQRHQQKKADLYTQRELDEALQWRAAARPTAAWAGRLPGDFVLAMNFLDDSLEYNAAISAARDRKRRLRTVGVAGVLVVMLAICANWVGEESKRLNQRISDADALLLDLSVAAQIDAAHHKRKPTPNGKDTCKAREAQSRSAAALSFKLGLYLPLLKALCDGAQSGSATISPEQEQFLAVASALEAGDLAETDLALQAIEDETTRRAAESMIDEVLDLQTPEIAKERRRLAALASNKEELLKKVGANIGTVPSAFRHPVHRHIAEQLGKGDAKDGSQAGARQLAKLTQSQRELLARYPDGPPLDPAPSPYAPASGAVRSDASAASAGAAAPGASAAAQPTPVNPLVDAFESPALYSEAEMHQRMLLAAGRPESAFAELQTALATYAWASLVLLPWPIWKLRRLWQRKRGRPIAERPGILRLALAALADLGLAFALSFAVYVLIDSTETIFKGSWGDGGAFALMLLLLVLPGLAYALLCDAIRLRYCRSIGKIAFDLRPVTLGPAPSGDFGLKASLRRNGAQLVLQFIWLCAVGLGAAAIDDNGVLGAWVLMGAPALLLAMWTRRDAMDRWSASRVIDADCDTSRRIDAPPRYLDSGPAGLAVAPAAVGPSFQPAAPAPR